MKMLVDSNGNMRPLLNKNALENLACMDSTIPCDEMSPCDWCEEHCKPEMKGAQAECWERYLLMEDT